MRLLLPYNTQSLPVSFYSDFHTGIAEAALELGHKTLRLDIADGAQASAAERDALYRALTARRCDAVIDLCCWGLGFSRITVWDGSKSGEPLFDSLDMAYMGLLLDQPWFQPLPGVSASRLYAAVPDRNHAEQIALIYPGVRLRGTAFAPPAVHSVNDRSRPWNERDIDVLFVGHLQRDALATSEHRRWPDGCAALCEATVETALAAPDEPLHVALLSAARSSGTALEGAAGTATVLEALRAVEPYLRARHRLEAVRAAAGSRAGIHVVGLGWDATELPGNVIRHAPTDYAGFFDMAGRARLCLDVSSYPDGANDRVFSYSLNRAVCLTNAAGYLRDAYAGTGAMQFCSPAQPAALAASISALLADTHGLRDMGDAGRRFTLDHQNWRVRLQAMLDCLAANP
ncbi:MAG: hypothetical protein FJY55_05830 [Betaproteobacteria bacterium]|nr:hypothetical protein [Betaproteobacteria bacterium]